MSTQPILVEALMSAELSSAGGGGHHILVVDDEQDMCAALVARLSGLGFRVSATTSAEEALQRVMDTEYDAALVDVYMPGVDGLQLCSQLTAASPQLPVVMMTGRPSVESAVGAMRSRAYDFLPKPVDAERMQASLLRAVGKNNVRRELCRLAKTRGSAPPGVLIGQSKVMLDLEQTIQRVSASDASVLIQGETGTGKELVARRIHEQSARYAKPFVAINCAAVPAGLLESELFGHTTGAFTDAREARQGLFLEARGGTLFLDELGELPLELQPKLLRALQERVVRAVGSNVETRFDARIVAATNRPLDVEVAERRFREDLYYRVAVVTVRVPPLRARGTDVLALAAHVLGRLSPEEPITLSEQAAERLLAHEWPGNVRQLENCLERAVALAQTREIAAADLPENVGGIGERLPSFVPPEMEPRHLEEFGMDYVHQVLLRLKGNKTRTAQVLGIDRRTLHRKLARERQRGRKAS